MTPKTIKYELTEDMLIEQFGPTALSDLARDNGYPVLVVNPNYIPAVGNEYLLDELTATYQLDMNGQPVPNPDYVAAVGEQEIKNPQTRLDFIAECVAAKGIDGTAERTKQRLLKATLAHAEQTFLTDFNARIAAIKGAVRKEVIE